jgi:hypothetical protein
MTELVISGLEHNGNLLFPMVFSITAERSEIHAFCPKRLRCSGYAAVGGGVLAVGFGVGHSAHSPLSLGKTKDRAPGGRQLRGKRGTPFLDRAHMMGLTKQQRACLNAIRTYHEKTGAMPSVQELCDALGFASKSAVWGLLVRLEQRGAIKRIPGAARAIALKRTRCPHCGKEIKGPR